MVYMLLQKGYEVYLFQNQTPGVPFWSVESQAYSKELIQKKLEELAIQLTDADQLFVYVTNHGMKFPFFGKRAWIPGGAWRFRDRIRTKK